MSEMVRIHNGSFGRALILNLESGLVEHAHSEAHLLFWLDGDQNVMKVGEKCVAFDSDNAVAINSWEPHSVMPIAKNHRCLFLLLYLDTAWLAKTFSQFGFLPLFTTPTLKVSKHLNLLVLQIIKLLLNEKDKAIDIELCITELLETALCSMQINNFASSISYKNNVHMDFRIRKSINYMQNHLDVRQSFDDVAKEAGISRPHFFSLFRKHMNMTPSVFWNTLRMETAINELVSTDISLNDLSYILGFSEPCNFSRFFRKHVGVAPSKYRLVGGGNLFSRKNEIAHIPG